MNQDTQQVVVTVTRHLIPDTDPEDGATQAIIDYPSPGAQLHSTHLGKTASGRSIIYTTFTEIIDPEYPLPS